MPNTQNLEPAAEDLLRSGKERCQYLSDIPPLYSIAISLRRIADALTETSPTEPSILQTLMNIDATMANARNPV